MSKALAQADDGPRRVENGQECAKLRVLDLFSGIGGFSLGLERTGGFETVAFCERDPFCRRLLAKLWPGVPCFEDVCALGREQVASLGAIDAICGGFPCQDISNAGGRAGIEGERSGLWREYARVIGEVRPLYVIVENVGAIRWRGLGAVLGDLHALGFNAWWDCVPASFLGYPHQRDRIWIVAYSAALRRDEGIRASQGWRRLIRDRALGGPSPWASAANDDKVRSSLLRIVDGLPDRVDRLGALGNAVIPEFPEIIGRAILAAESERVAA